MVSRGKTCGFGMLWLMVCPSLLRVIGIIVFFIIAATGAKRELNLVLVMGSCWAERVEDLKKEAN